MKKQWNEDKKTYKLEGGSLSATHVTDLYPEYIKSIKT